MKYKDFKNRYLNRLCRSCINEVTGLHFKSEDCHHETYSHACSRCGKRKHIIVGLHPSAKIKLWFFRPPKTHL